MKRVPTTELLDTDAGTPREIADSIADLRMFNRWFGGISCTSHMVERVVRQTKATSLSWLDVASGAGYVPHMVRDHLAQRKVKVAVTLLDRAASHLTNGTGPAANGTRSVVGDALSLPFRNDSFDLVSSELFVHHLPPEQVTIFVREGLRVCRKAFLINDLIRDPIHLALAYAGFPLYRSRLTRNDAPASVRQAYTPDELLALIRQTGAERIDIEFCYLYRMGFVVWKA